MQKHVNLVDLVKSFPTNIFLQNLASIQQRTSLIKFDQLDEKSEEGSISNLSTKVAMQGTFGWFVSQESCERYLEGMQAAAMLQGPKIRFFAVANFCKFWRARSRLYQNENLQENMRLTTFFKLYKICILLHRCNLKIFAKKSV